MMLKLLYTTSILFASLSALSASSSGSSSAARKPAEPRHKNVVIDSKPPKLLPKERVVVKNPSYPGTVTTGQGPSKEDDEFVNVETKLQPNGEMKLNFTSHGRKHTLELRESKVLADIPINLVGSSQEFADEVNRKRKSIKTMKDTKRGGLLAVERTDEQAELKIKRGMFRLGKHQFEISGDFLNRTRVSKKLIKDTPPKLRDSVRFRETSRRKRAIPVEVTPISATVELAMIVDYSVWSHMSSGDVTALDQSDHMINLLLYYAHMVDIMNEHYKTMLNDAVHVSVAIAGIVVITTDSQLSTLTEDKRVSGGKVDSSDTLDGLAEWMGTTEASNTLPRNDHTMLFTRYDMYDKKTGETGTVGLAYSGAICDSKLSVSLVEVGEVLSYDASTAAHELGHSLGAGHDEVDNGCADHNYVMAAYSGTNSYLTNRFQFSCCSQRSFYGVITDTGGCLMEGIADPDHDPSIDTNVETYLPGQIFSADDQCYIAEGTKACDDSTYTQESTNICLNLYCELASDSSFCFATLTAAADGTDCDVGKWCIQSECVDKSQTYSLPDQNCDVTNCHTKESECSNGVNIDAPEMFRCYSDNVYCDGIPDCSDGTDEKGCNKTFTCPPGYTKCHFGKSAWQVPAGVPEYCIYNSWLCDGSDNDCTDNSDENELCSEFYICQDTNICINKEEDCEKDCPDDKDCIDGLKSLKSGVVRAVQDYRCIVFLAFCYAFFS